MLLHWSQLVGVGVRAKGGSSPENGQLVPTTGKVAATQSEGQSANTQHAERRGHDGHSQDPHANTHASAAGRKHTVSGRTSWDREATSAPLQLGQCLDALVERREIAECLK